MADESNALHLISDILDKLIDTQQNNAEASASLKSAVFESNKILYDIRAHFTNGFRSEIKKHITSEIEEFSQSIISDIRENSRVAIECSKANQTKQDRALESIQDISLKMNTLMDTLNKPWFWIKLVGTVVVALGVIIGAVSKLLQYVP